MASAMATSCCCRREATGPALRVTQKNNADKAQGDSSFCPREPEAAHLERRQQQVQVSQHSGLCKCPKRTTRNLWLLTTWARERSRPPLDAQGLAVMQCAHLSRPRAHRCAATLAEEREVEDAENFSTTAQEAQDGIAPTFLEQCGRRLLSGLIGEPSRPMHLPPELSRGAKINQNQSRSDNQTYATTFPRVPCSFARVHLLMTTTLYLVLASHPASTSLINTITSSSNHNNNISQKQQQQQHFHKINSPAAALDASALESSKLARQLFASHYQNQLLSHIESQAALAAAAAASGASGPDEAAAMHQKQHQATTTHSWPSSYDNLARLYDGQQQHQVHELHSPRYPEPPVNQPPPPPPPPPPSSSSSGQTIAGGHLQHAQPTTPTLNKQLAPPPPQPFFELGLLPTNVLQLSRAVAEGPRAPNHDKHGEQMHAHVTRPMAMLDSMPHHQMMQASESVPQISVRAPPLPSTSANASRSASSSRDARAMMRAPVQNDILGKSSDQMALESDASGSQSDGSVSTSNSQNSDSKFDNDNHSGGSGGNSNTEQSGPVDKGIEPRQKRRMFNRILKKAEWNHLFLELSKVFLRYFLDLALKDIMGKQSGSLGGSSSSGDSTTGRKKLDTQSELADMFKEIVKNAITNLR